VTPEDQTSDQFTWRPVTPERWGELEALFGPSGAYSGCWCMWFRVKRSEWEARCANGGSANRQSLHEIVQRGDVPGILAYADGQPVGWCSVAPREQFPVLDRSPLFKRRDDEPIWSIVCFYVARSYRSRGAMAFLVRAAVEYARERGGKIVEAYPRRSDGRLAAASGYVGLLPAFENAGFVEIAQPNATRSIVRYRIT
jgi:GNAT superfamily N-acetyltransferase